MILVFNTAEALANFTSGKSEWELGADASAAVAKMGAGGALDTTNLKADIVSFIFGGQGLMADASFAVAFQEARRQVTVSGPDHP